MLKWVFAAVMLAGPVAAENATIQKDWVGCTTQDLVWEFIGAIQNDDRRQVEALLSDGCVPLQGVEYSLVDEAFELVQLRIYQDDTSQLIWVVSQAIE